MITNKIDIKIGLLWCSCFLPVHEYVKTMKLLLAEIAISQKIRGPKLSLHISYIGRWSREHTRGSNHTSIITNTIKLVIVINTFLDQIIAMVRNDTSIALWQFIHLIVIMIINIIILQMKPTSEIRSGSRWRRDYRDRTRFRRQRWISRDKCFMSMGSAQIGHGSHYAKTNHISLEISWRLGSVWWGWFSMRESGEKGNINGGFLFPRWILHFSATGYLDSSSPKLSRELKILK